MRSRNSSAYFMQFATFGIALMMMVSPWVVSLFGVKAKSVENRRLSEFPELSLSALGNASTFSKISEYIEDRTPLRGRAAQTLGKLALATDLSTNPSVFFGPENHLLLSEDFEKSCSVGYDMDLMVEVFAKWDKAANEGDKKWIFTVVPDKGAVLDGLLSGRSDAAMSCGRGNRMIFRQKMSSASSSALDLWTNFDELTTEERLASYYKNDSHWTFASAGEIGGAAIIDRWLPGAWRSDYVVAGGRTLRLTADIAARLGVDASKTVEVLESERPGISYQIENIDVSGTRPVRIYKSSGGPPLISGRTIVLHDSMMNFLEYQIAPYFEHIEFIHWNDLNRASFMSRVASSDRVIIEVVERNVHSRLGRTILSEPFISNLASSLAAQRNIDDELVGELASAVDAVRRYEEDTGELVDTFGQLLQDNVEGWNGPYLNGPIFETGSHPRYGEWRTIAQVDRSIEGSFQRCESSNNPSCGTWVLLLGVPPSLVGQLDLIIDEGDGLSNGDLRLSLPHEIVYVFAGR